MIVSRLKSIFLVAAILLTIVSCSDDESSGSSSKTFVAAFENLSANLSTIENSQEIAVVYSETTKEEGVITILVDSENAIYGEDFSTQPAAENNMIKLPILQSENGTTILFNKLNPAVDETVEITFTILIIDYPGAQIQGNTTFSLNSSASLGRGFEPNVGGANQPNQVYIDLSAENQKAVKRDSWDLGFYSDDDFRVGINGSIYMASAQLEYTNIDEVTQKEVVGIQNQVAVGTFDPANQEYIDHPDGNITKTAIDVISEHDAENKVYLVNLGYEVGTDNPESGSVAVAGDLRGWKKIRVLKSNGSYLLQYADLNDTTHQEIRIEKDRSANFTFFSFNSNSTLAVQPKAENWDLNFTVFTNILEGAGSYGFSDGVLHNRKGGVVAYSVNTGDFNYEDFQLNNVNNDDFQLDQRVIGSSWRDVINDDKVLVDTIFYVIKDPNGNIYKLKFTALLDDIGERGYPQFKYNLLQ